jgi:hypothetical protein
LNSAAPFPASAAETFPLYAGPAVCGACLDTDEQIERLLTAGRAGRALHRLAADLAAAMTP